MAPKRLTCVNSSFLLISSINYDRKIAIRGWCVLSVALTRVKVRLAVKVPHHGWNDDLANERYQWQWMIDLNDVDLNDVDLNDIDWIRRLIGMDVND